VSFEIPEEAFKRPKKVLSKVICDDGGNLHPSDLQIFAIENNIHKAEEHREPVPDHRIICLQNILLPSWWVVKAAFRTLEHLRNEFSQHGCGDKTNPLKLADFAEVSDADCKIRKGTMVHDGGEMIPIDHCYNVKCVGRNTLCNLVSGCLSGQVQSTHR
jgi:hypothetical protein